MSHVLISKWEKKGTMPARSVTTPLVTKRAGIAARFVTDCVSSSNKTLLAYRRLKGYCTSLLMLKGPRNAVVGYKIAPNCFKTTYSSVLTERRNSLLKQLFQTFSGFRLGCNAVFWQKVRKIQSTERFKTSAILNARFCESCFQLRVNDRAVTLQTDKQPNVEVGSVWVCTGQPTSS